MTRALADRSLSEVSTNKRVSGFQGRSVWTRIPPELTFSVEANIRVKGCVALESIARNVLRFRFSFRSSIVEPPQDPVYQQSRRAPALEAWGYGDIVQLKGTTRRLSAIQVAKLDFVLDPEPQISNLTNSEPGRPEGCR